MASVRRHWRQAERIMQSRSSMAPIPNASMAHMALMVTPLTST
jgi:hypothetical protein